jgi:hypothetical protein
MTGEDRQIHKCVVICASDDAKGTRLVEPLVVIWEAIKVSLEGIDYSLIACHEQNPTHRRFQPEEQLMQKSELSGRFQSRRVIVE